jgi:hypothetical protein
VGTGSKVITPNFKFSFLAFSFASCKTFDDQRVAHQNYQ